jgi:hypothetical protein
VSSRSACSNSASASGITVTVTFFSARWPSDGQSVAVIRQRLRSDRKLPTSHRLCTSDCGESTPRVSRWKTRPLPTSRCFARTRPDHRRYGP